MYSELNSFDKIVRGYIYIHLLWGPPHDWPENGLKTPPVHLWGLFLRSGRIGDWEDWEEIGRMLTLRGKVEYWSL